jgi:hypothetical protein
MQVFIHIMTSNAMTIIYFLGCHDYHGNHDMVLEKTVGRAIKQEQLLDYFRVAESPYAGSLITKAKSTRYEK